MRNIAKRSAANRKAWRTRKRMAQARKIDRFCKGMTSQLQKFRTNELTREFVDYLKPEELTGRLGSPAGHNVWPAYMTRALPNPWSKDLSPW